MVSLCFCHQFFCQLSVRLVGSLGLAMSAIQTWIHHPVLCFCVSPCCASLNKNEPLGTHSMPKRASKKDAERRNTAILAVRPAGFQPAGERDGKAGSPPAAQAGKPVFPLSGHFLDTL